MTLLELIAQGLSYITSWLPRPLIVTTVERLVVWEFGLWPRVLGPGIHVMVPLFERWEVISILRDPTTLESVTVWTKDGFQVYLELVLVWFIDDPMKAANTTNDLDEMVGEAGQGTLPPLVSGWTLEELRAKITASGREWSFNRHVAAEAQKVLSEYGVRVVSARLNYTACEAFMWGWAVDRVCAAIKETWRTE